MRIISKYEKKVILREKEVKQAYENIYVDETTVYYYYPEVDMAIVIASNKQSYTKSHYKNFYEKMNRLHKGTVEEYAENVASRFKSGMPISVVEITLLADQLGSDFVREYKRSISATKKEREDYAKARKDTALRARMNYKEIVKEAERKFKNYEYVENIEILGYDSVDRPFKTALFCLMLDDLGVVVHPQTKHWMKYKLKGSMGDRVVDCEGTNSFVFMALKEIMKKLNEEEK